MVQLILCLAVLNAVCADFETQEFNVPCVWMRDHIDLGGRKKLVACPQSSAALKVVYNKNYDEVFLVHGKSWCEVRMDHKAGGFSAGNLCRVTSGCYCCSDAMGYVVLCPQSYTQGRITFVKPNLQEGMSQGGDCVKDFSLKGFKAFPGHFCEYNIDQNSAVITRFVCEYLQDDSQFFVKVKVDRCNLQEIFVSCGIRRPEGAGFSEQQTGGMFFSYPPCNKGGIATYS